MRYSFIEPKTKPIFSVFTQLWLIFIAVCIALMLLFDLAVNLYISSHKSDMTKMLQNEKKLEANIQIKQKSLDEIRLKQKIADEIYASNKILQESMQNLFDLVPDQITLSKVVMDKNKLILYGITPSKDTFNFLLASPLRSIFHTNNTVFYLNEKGWYRFVSTNEMNEMEEYDEQR